MGIFDQLTNLSPEQNQGLLAAAAQILQQSGPSRMPTSFGQILGGGLQAYQGGVSEAQKRKMEEEQARQMAQLRDLQVQAGTGDLQAQQQSREQQAAIDAAAQSSVSNGQFDQNAFLQQVRAISPLKAVEFERQLAKAGPEFDTKPQTAIGPDGKPFQYIIAKNGQVQRLDGILPRDELKLANLGGRDVAYNPYALQEGQSFQRTQTPDSAASVAATLRGQNMTDARARELNAITAGQKAPTEFQGKSAAFGLRATEANKILSGLEGKGVTNTGITKSVAQGAVGMVPFLGDKLESAVGAGFNTLPSFLGGPNEQQQQVEQARRDFVNAVLRQESGAAIGQTEFDNATKQYFPQPGDTKTVIAQKQRNRELAIQGLQSNAGRAALTAPPKSGGGWGIQKVSD